MDIKLAIKRATFAYLAMHFVDDGDLHILWNHIYTNQSILDDCIRDLNTPEGTLRPENIA